MYDNQLFSFDPLKFSISAKWAMKTLDINTFHSGLSFGSNENTIYAYSDDK